MSTLFTIYSFYNQNRVCATYNFDINIILTLTGFQYSVSDTTAHASLVAYQLHYCDINIHVLARLFSAPFVMFYELVLYT